MLGPLLRIQKVLFVEAVKTVLPTVKISKTSIKFLEYPVSITIPKKDTVLKMVTATGRDKVFSQPLNMKEIQPI